MEHRSLVVAHHSLRSALSWIAALSLPFLGVVVVLDRFAGIPIEYLTRDPVAIAEHPFYAGFLSNVGIVLWAAAAAVCLFSAALLPAHGDGHEWKRFLRASGLLTLLLALDDLFLLHEDFLPNYVGIPEDLVSPAYGIVGLAYLFHFRAVVLRTEWLLLALAAVLFGSAVVIDSDLFWVPYLESHLAEDGTKFAGIVSWFVYFVRVSARALPRWQTGA